MTVSNYAYHKTIRKLVVAFGNLFNEIKLARYDSDGKEVEHFLVPLVYGGKEKYVSRLEGDPELDKKVQVTLPIMSFEMGNMNYDAGRKLNTNIRNSVASGGASTSLAVYNPVPFDFEFSLYAYVRNIEDGAQLMEKILPYFTPDYTISLNMIPEMGLIKQVPIILKSVTNEIDYEGDYNTKIRSVIWTLNFTVKGYLYGPVTEPKIVRASYTNIINDLSLHDYNIVGTMSTGGLGTYRTGESVYQGASYSNHTASGTVASWNSTSKLLEITDLFGHFVSGYPIKGVETNAKWTPSSFDVTSNAVVQIVVTPNPTNVIPPNNYTYTVTTTESPNIP